MKKISHSYPKLLIGGAIITAIVAVYFAQSKTATIIPLKNQKTIKVQLKWFHQAQFAGMYVAQSKGYYKQMGLEVELIPHQPEQQPPIERLRSGEADIAITNSFDALREGSTGNAKAIAAIYQINPSALISLPETKLSKPEDLKNKKIGVSDAVGETSSLIQTLTTKYKVPINTLELVNNGFRVIQPLQDREVDINQAYRTDLYSFKEEGIKYNILLPEQFGIQSYNDIIMVRTSLIQESPKLIQNFLDATRQGWEYALANQEEAAKISLEYVQEPQYKNLERQKHILSESAPLIKPNSDVPIGSMNEQNWQQTYKTYKQILVQPNFDYHNVYTIQFLP